MSEDRVCYQCGGYGCHHCNYIPHRNTGRNHEQDLQKLGSSQHPRPSVDAGALVDGLRQGCKRSS